MVEINVEELEKMIKDCFVVDANDNLIIPKKLFIEIMVGLKEEVNKMKNEKIDNSVII